MPELEEGAANAVPATPPEDAETGGTTPQEVADVLSKSGIKVDVPATEESEEDDDDENDTKPPANADVATGAQGDKPADAGGPDEAKPTGTAVTKPEAKTEAVAEEPKTFTMEVVDADGVTHKISASDDIEEALAEFNPKSNGQIMKVLDDFRSLKDQAAQHEQEQATAKIEAERAEAVAKIQAGWNTEIKDLQATNRIAKTDKEAETRTNAIHAYMSAENQKRQEAGRPLLESMEDALNGLERQEAAAATAKAAKDAKATARANGGLVGGSSAPASSGLPAYRANAGHRTADQALKAQGLL
jgi:hypothetical protein